MLHYSIAVYQVRVNNTTPQWQDTPKNKLGFKVRPARAADAKKSRTENRIMCIFFFVSKVKKKNLRDKVLIYKLDNYHILLGGAVIALWHLITASANLHLEYRLNTSHFDQRRVL